MGSNGFMAGVLLFVVTCLVITIVRDCEGRILSNNYAEPPFTTVNFV